MLIPYASFYKIFIILIASIMMFSCDSVDTSKTAKITSSNFSSLDKKILTLEKYVYFRRSYNSLDFSIDYHDNSTGFLTAPSDWDIRIIAIVPKNEINHWVSGLTLSTKPTNTAWLHGIPSNINYQSITEWYEQYGQEWVGVDRVNGIVVYRNVAY